jgi:protein MpaA
LGNKVELLGKAGENNVLIIGVFHGDEPQGKYLIDEYLKKIYEYPQREGRIYSNLIFIPCLNPDGLQNKTRTNANGVDLNRNFPTKNWGEDTSAAGDNPQDYYGGKSAGSEIETQFVINIIEKYKPKAILTLHAPYKIVNYDGPAQDIAQKISDIIGYPVEESIGYPTPGSFGTYCGVERNIPTITLELDEKIPVEQLEQLVFDIFDLLTI